ncbi:hypothetical protein HII36_43275, partial [Nonomuraea sp. NN258]|uniref:hypothetical protein n=1 Tax=Nonomuraea antri TaxID=2730852 RepID=UPI002E286E12
MSGDQRKFELSGPQIVGSALAAVTAAVAASYLGVAGTVIGAAVVSVASTVATAVYTHYLKRTGDRVRQHTLTGRREDEHEHAADEAGADEPAEGERRGARLPWLKVGLAAALVFAVSMGGILAYQAVADTTVHEQVTGKAPHREQRDQPPAERNTPGGDDTPVTDAPAPGESGEPSHSPSTSPTTAPPAETPTPT